MKFNLEFNLKEIEMLLNGLTKLPLEISYTLFNETKEKYEQLIADIQAATKANTPPIPGPTPDPGPGS